MIVVSVSVSVCAVFQTRQSPLPIAGSGLGVLGGGGYSLVSPLLIQENRIAKSKPKPTSTRARAGATSKPILTNIIFMSLTPRGVGGGSP